jgi:hypothetical protein
MESGKAYFFACTLRPGGFLSERVFTIPLKSGSTLRGVAPAGYCFTAERQPIDESLDTDEVIDGFVIGVVLGLRADGVLRLHLPDGNIYEVLSDSMTAVPTRDIGHVSVQS